MDRRCNQKYLRPTTSPSTFPSDNLRSCSARRTRGRLKTCPHHNLCSIARDCRNLRSQSTCLPRNCNRVQTRSPLGRLSTCPQDRQYMPRQTTCRRKESMCPQHTADTRLRCCCQPLLRTSLRSNLCRKQAQTRHPDWKMCQEDIRSRMKSSFRSTCRLGKKNS